MIFRFIFLFLIFLHSASAFVKPLSRAIPSDNNLSPLQRIMTTPADKKETVILQTSDDEQFTVEKRVAERSAMIKTMLEGQYLLNPSIVMSSTFV